MPATRLRDPTTIAAIIKSFETTKNMASTGAAFRCSESSVRTILRLYAPEVLTAWQAEGRVHPPKLPVEPAPKPPRLKAKTKAAKPLRKRRTKVA